MSKQGDLGAITQKSIREHAFPNVTSLGTSIIVANHYRHTL